MQPAAGDGGGALGAALWAYNTLLGKPRNFQMDHAYWGRANSDAEIGDFLQPNNITHTRYDDEDKMLDAVVDHLTSAKVIGWAQGRFEWGPRALGSRSILADPRNPEMKDIVNTKIKFREPYRPFAPSVLAESAEKYFDLPNAMKHVAGALHALRGPGEGRKRRRFFPRLRTWMAPDACRQYSRSRARAITR